VGAVVGEVPGGHAGAGFHHVLFPGAAEGFEAGDGFVVVVPAGAPAHPDTGFGAAAFAGFAFGDGGDVDVHPGVERREIERCRSIASVLAGEGLCTCSRPTGGTVGGAEVQLHRAAERTA